MNSKERLILGTVLPFLFLLNVAGCDVEFGSGDSGSGGSSTAEAGLSGEVYEVNSGDDVEGITVGLEDENSGNTYEDTTDSGGGFEITGGFCGSSTVTLTDSEGTRLAVFSLDVIPGSDTDIGSLTVSSGTVTFEDEIITEFDGYVTENDCDGTSGTLTVEVDNDCDTVEVLVTVTRSTNVTDGEDDIDCDEINTGAEVQIYGGMSVGSGVEGYDIEVTD